MSKVYTVYSLVWKINWEVSGEGILLNGKYELIATTIDHEEIGSYIGYGIR